MLDLASLHAAYEGGGFYSLQLEVGDRCLQGCIYCYMNALEREKNTLTDEEIYGIIDDSHSIGIAAVEWLGGEPLLRRSVFTHMAHATELGIRNNVWTGGLPLANGETLRNTVKHAAHGLISVHVSTIDPALYGELHPSRPVDDLKSILDAVKRTIDMGYPPAQMLNSVTFTGLQSADDLIHTIDYFESEFGIKTSLNVYHTYLRPGTPPGTLSRFIPAEEAVKRVYDRCARQWGEMELPMNCVSKQYCSTTVAVLCDGCVTPCATIRDACAPNIHRDGAFRNIVESHRDHLTIGAFRSRKNLPPGCRTCRLSDRCFGCRSRAYAAGNGILGKDPRCFRKRNAS